MICNSILYSFKLSQWLRVPECILTRQTQTACSSWHPAVLSFTALTQFHRWTVQTLGSLLPSDAAVKWHSPSHGWCLSCFISADKQLLLFVSFILYIGKTIIARNCRGRNHYLCTIVVTELLGLLKISISFCFLICKCFLFCPLLFQQLNHQLLLH